MSGWFLAAIMACGQPETAAEAPGGDAGAKAGTPDGAGERASSEGTAEWPTADQVLLAHTRTTRQCEVLAADAYVFNWSSTMDDGHSQKRVEAIVHQGKPGVSFTRIHQRREPNVRFAAFGRTPKGKYWSASDGGVQADLPEEAALPLMAGMDPTPVCNFERRWPSREMIGPEDRDGVPTWHLKVAWSDGTGSDLWFHREANVLVASSAKAGDVETTTELSDYQEHDGIQWPMREVATRQEGPVHIKTTQTLEKLDVNPEQFAEVGPNQVAAILANAADQAAK